MIVAPSDWFENEATLVGALKRGSGNGAPPPVIDGYDDLIELNRGGQGVVYTAVDRADGAQVAIKVLRPERFANETDRRRFEREIELVSMLEHPHLVSIRTSGLTDDERPYLVMDFVEGVPLDEYLLGPDRRPSTLPDVRRVLQVFVQVCDAVHYAHQHGVIHRDLKPSNIRVDDDGRPHVLDFGLALPVIGGATEFTEVTMTGTGEFVGTLAFASPEQIDTRGGSVDLRSDVYSLGTILYQLLAARRPFVSDTSLRGTIDAILHDDPPALSTIRDIDDDVETIVLQCLAKEQGRRYQSAGDLARDIRRHLSGEPIEARREGAWHRAQRTLQRYRFGAAAVAIVAIALAVTTVATAVLYKRAEDAGDLARNRERAAAREAANARTAIRFLQQTLTMADPRFRDTSDPTLRSVLDGAAARYKYDLAGQPEAARDIALTLGRAYYHLGELDQAAKLVQSAVNHDRAFDGDLAESLAVLGLVRHAQGRLDEAKAVFEENVELWGDRDPARVRPLIDLGNVHAAQGKFDLAEVVWRRARKEAEWCGIDTGLVDFHLGRLFVHLNDLDTAEPLLEGARAKLERLEGPTSIPVADCLQTLASLRLAQRRLDEADEFASSAKSIYESRVDSASPRVAHCLVILAQSRFLAEDPHAALELLGEAESIYRKKLGDDHTSVARVLDRRGYMLHESGDHEAAEPLLRESLRIYRLQSGETNSDTAIVKSNLGCCLAALGRNDEADRFLRESLSILEGEFGPDDPRVVEARGCLDAMAD